MIREAFKELKKDEIQMFEGKMTVDWNKFVIGAVEKSKVVKKDKPKAVKSEVKKNKPKAAKQPKVEVKKETVTKSEPKIVKPEKVEKSKSEKVKNSESKISSPTSEEPVRVKGSKYKNPEQEKTTPIQTIPTEITGKDMFRKELVADQYFSAVLNNMENPSDRTQYVDEQWEMLSSTTKKLYDDEAASSKKK